MTYCRIARRLNLVAFTSLLLAACGGGGSGDSTQVLSSPQDPAPAPVTSPVNDPVAAPGAVGSVDGAKSLQTWGKGELVASGVPRLSSYKAVLDRSGAMTVIYTNDVTTFGNQGNFYDLYAVHGSPPGADRARVWSAPVLLARMKMAIGQADNESVAVAASPTGYVHVVWPSNAGTCPASTGLPAIAFGCGEFRSSVYSPDARTWSAPTVVTSTSADPAGRTGKALVDDLGNAGYRFQGQSAVSGGTSFTTRGRGAIAWRAAAESDFKSIVFEELESHPGFDAHFAKGEMIVAGQAKSSTVSPTILSYQASIKTGFPSNPAASRLNSGPGDVVFLALATGIGGRSLAVWTQRPASGLVTMVSDRTPLTIWTEPQSLVKGGLFRGSTIATVSDAGVALVFSEWSRYSNDAGSPTWNVEALKHAIVDQAPGPEGDYTTAARLIGVANDGSHLLVLPPLRTWQSYTDSNRQVRSLYSKGEEPNELFYVFGFSTLNPAVRRPSQTLFTKTRSGAYLGALVLDTNLDVLPTPSAPNGTARTEGANLWVLNFL